MIKWDGNGKAPGTRLQMLRCFGRVGENGRKFHTFCEEGIAKLNRERTAT